MDAFRTRIFGVSAIMLGAFVFFACVSDGSSVTLTHDSPGDGGAPDATAADGSTSIDGGETNDGGAGDSGSDAGPSGPYCQTAAANDASFCADFESVAHAGDNWDSVTKESDAAVGLDTTLGANGSQRSAVVTLGAAEGSGIVAGLNKTVFGGVRSVVTIELDARFDFATMWYADNDKEDFFSIALSTGAGPAYAIDLERTSAYMIVATGGVAQNITVPEGVFHHFVIRFDGTTVPSTLTLMMDGLSKGNISLPGSAPATFDTIAMSAEAKVLNEAATTAVHFDNVLVH